MRGGVYLRGGVYGVYLRGGVYLSRYGIYIPKGQG